MTDPHRSGQPTRPRHQAVGQAPVIGMERPAPEKAGNGTEPLAGEATMHGAAAANAAVDWNWPAVAASALGLLLCVGTLSIYSFGVFVRPLAAEFKWSRTELFGAVAISQYALAFSAPVWGLLVDRFGPRAVMLPSVVAISALVASLALLTPHLWHLYLIFCLIPVLAGGASPLGYSAVIIRQFDRKLGQALGLALMGVGLGAALLPPLSQALVGVFAWRGAYAALGLVTLLVTFPAALVATRHSAGPIRQNGALAAGTVMAILRTRACVLMFLAFVILGLISVGGAAHLVPIMSDRGFDPAAAARFAALSGFAAVIARGGLGWVLDRVHASYVLAAVALTAAAAFLLLLLADGPLAGAAAVILLGSVIGAEVDFISFLVRRYFGQAAYGKIYGLAFGFFIFGAGTGPILLSVSFDRLGGYRPGLLLFVGLSLAVAALALALPPYHDAARASAPTPS